MEASGNGQVESPAPPVDLGRQLQIAIGAYFGVEPDAVLGFVVACERVDAREGLTLSSVWSSDTPVWRLESFAHEALRSMDEQLRRPPPAALEGNRKDRRGKKLRRS